MSISALIFDGIILDTYTVTHALHFFHRRHTEVRCHDKRHIPFFVSALALKELFLE